MVKKWQTLIEASLDVRTTDGYLLRVFCIGFTTKDAASTRKTCYAQHSQVRAIRKKMCDIITRDVSSSDLKEVVNKLLPDSIAKDIEKACHGIYPLHDVYIRKVSCRLRIFICLRLSECDLAACCVRANKIWCTNFKTFLIHFFVVVVVVV